MAYAIRVPVPAEGPIVSELVLQSDCGLLSALFGKGVKDLLTRLQAAPANPYSSENISVIVDTAEFASIIGAFVGSLAEATKSARLRTAALLVEWYGLGAFLRFPRLALAGKAMDDLRADDFYLSHLAVLPASRGRGAGRILLAAGEENARKCGARRMALDVERGNAGARSFYARLGYGETTAPRIDLGPRGLFSFVRMVKDL